MHDTDTTTDPAEHDEAGPGAAHPGATRPDASRFEAFAELARRRGDGEMVPLPRMLRGEDRRIHVRQTIREDHATRIADDAEDARAKFDKLADSEFSFFRGTALLFYRDLAGEDAWMPTVLTLGDVHPENFGVMPSQDNVPIFGPKDFDEATYAPFTWDLKRGATGFLVAAREEGVGKKARHAAVRAFVHGYLDGIADFAEHGREEDLQSRLDNSPPMIQDLIREAMDDPRSEWLEDKLDEQRREFRPSDRIVPQTSRVEEFQALVDRYTAERELPDRAGPLRVKDVAERKGSGTASLGLTRYWILLEGPAGDGTDDVILEMKQSRRSALAGLVPPSPYEVTGAAGRIADAHAVHLVGGDVFYGEVEFEERSFLVRERSPYKEEIDLDDLDDEEWATYATICGRAVAHAHALTDDAGQVEDEVEPRILEAVGLRDLFVDDVLRFARAALKRLRHDHAHFVADHELGAFRMRDTVYV